MHSYSCVSPGYGLNYVSKYLHWNKKKKNSQWEISIHNAASVNLHVVFIVFHLTCVLSLFVKWIIILHKSNLLNNSDK